MMHAFFASIGPRAAPSGPKELIYWESNAPINPPGAVNIARIGHFTARGMRRVYGRIDHFGGGFNLDIWKNNTGRLFMRCWSRYSDYDSASFEIIGATPPEVHKLGGVPQLTDDWVPKGVRETYEEWVKEEF